MTVSPAEVIELKMAALLEAVPADATDRTVLELDNNHWEFGFKQKNEDGHVLVSQMAIDEQVAKMLQDRGYTKTRVKGQMKI